MSKLIFVCELNYRNYDIVHKMQEDMSENIVYINYTRQLEKRATIRDLRTTYEYIMV